MTSTPSLSGKGNVGSAGAGAGTGAGAGATGMGTGAGAGAGAGAVQSRNSKRRGTRTRGALVCHDFGVAWRQVAPLLLAALVVFVVFMPISTAAIPDMSIFNLDYTHDQLKWRFWAPDALPVIYAAVVLFGMALGLRSFRFLLVKRETTTFLNLPLSRCTLGATRFGACLIALVAGIGVPLAASLAVNVAALGVWDGIFADFAYVWAGLVLTGAVACAVTAFCCMLAGTLAEAAAFAVTLLGLATVGAWGLGALADALLVGNAFGEYYYSGTLQVAPSLVQVSQVINPLLFFYNEAASHGTFMVQHPVYYPEVGNVGFLGAWCAVCLVVGVLALWRLSHRPGECAGTAGLCVPMSFVVGLVVGLAAFGAAFTLLAAVNVVAAEVAAFAVFVVVSLALFFGPLRGVGRTRTTLGVMGGEVVCLVAVVAVMSTGGLGFSSYVPETGQIQRVSVTYTGTPDFLAARFDTAQASPSSYYFSATYTLDAPNDVQQVCDVHRALASTGHATWQRDRKNFANTVVPYDVKIAYTLADGSEVVRYYDCATFAELYALACLDASPTVKALERATITGDVSEVSEDVAAALTYSSARQAYMLGEVYLCDAYYARPVKVNLEGAARSQLLAALAEDATAQSTENRYHPATPARGILMFSQAGQTDAQAMAYSLSNSVVYLTDEYTRTLAWLAENGLEQYLSQVDSSVIESMTFQRFDPYAGMNAVTAPQSALFMGYRAATASTFAVMQDFGTKYETVEPGELGEIAPLLRNQYFMDTGGYLVCAKLAGVDAYAYYFLPEDDVPEWLLRVAG